MLKYNFLPCSYAFILVFALVYFKSLRPISIDALVTFKGFHNISFKGGPVIFDNNVEFLYHKITKKPFKKSFVATPLLRYKDRNKLKGVSSGTFSLLREYCELCILENVHARADGLIRLSNGKFWKALERNSYPKNTSGICEIKVDDAILLSPVYHGVLGHILNDAILPLLNIPEYVFKRNPILITYCNIKILSIYLEAIGLGNIRIYNDTSKFVFCNSLYICKDIEERNSFGAYSFPILRDKLEKYFNLTNIKANKYHFVNKKQKHRHFNNIEEIANQINKNYNISMTQIYDENYTNIKMIARYYAETKVLIISGGSIVYNMIFCKKYTGAVILMAKLIDFPNIKFLVWLHIWGIGIVHHEMEHFGKSGNADKEYTIKAFEYVNYAVENKKFPSQTTGFYNAFNYSHIKNLYEKYSDIDLDFPIL